jgi:muramoyltetrapeptide carboxypeptidase
MAQGPLFGGNLAMLASLCGTGDQPTARGRVLFLEDVGEPAYRVDRMLLQLRRSGVLEAVAGLALGRFTGAGEDDEAAVAGVLREYAEALGVPCVADLPFGHVAHNCTLPVGVTARLDADAAKLEIVEAAVRDPAN